MDNLGAMLAGQPGELCMTIEIKRAATGLTEVHELVGTILPEPSPTETDEKEPPCL